jgi:serine/threonine-protein kinase RsbW
MPAPDLHLRIEREFAAVRRAAAQLRSFLSAHRLSEPELWACELAMVEACNNAVQHTRADPPIEIDIRLRSGEIEIRINDQGSRFELPETSDLPPPGEESGRGLYLIRRLMDHVAQERAQSNNCLVLRKNLAGI